MPTFAQLKSCECGVHRALRQRPLQGGRRKLCASALREDPEHGASIVAATILGATLAGLQAGLPSSAHAADSFQSLVHSIPSPVADVANEAPFWENVLRYVQYFFSIMLGTGYVMLKPFAQLLRNPLTGVLVIGGAVALVYAIKITVNAMLGVDDLFEYQASSIVTAQT